MFTKLMMIYSLVIGINAFAQTVVSTEKFVNQDGTITIKNPSFLVSGETLPLSSALNDGRDVCGIYGLGDFISFSMIQFAENKKKSVKINKIGGFVYIDYSTTYNPIIISLICSPISKKNELFYKQESDEIIQKVISVAEIITQDQLYPMPNILEDSKTGDYFGFHCLQINTDGTCKQVRAFFYVKSNQNFYLYSRPMNSEFINYLEFKKGYNWSNETKEIKHGQFLSTLERFR